VIAVDHLEGRSGALREHLLERRWDCTVLGGTDVCLLDSGERRAELQRFRQRPDGLAADASYGGLDVSLLAASVEAGAGVFRWNGDGLVLLDEECSVGEKCTVGPASNSVDIALSPFWGTTALR
jgi:hypothetical protein